MSAQHTPGRLSYEYEPGYCGELIASNGTTIATLNDEPIEANARRLVACWNACQVITDPENVVPRLLALNELVPNLEHQAATLRVQRDELLAALEKIAGFTMSQFMGPHDMALECVTVARNAIAKATGEQT